MISSSATNDPFSLNSQEAETVTKNGEIFNPFGNLGPDVITTNSTSSVTVTESENEVKTATKTICKNVDHDLLDSLDPFASCKYFVPIFTALFYISH